MRGQFNLRLSAEQRRELDRRAAAAGLDLGPYLLEAALRGPISLAEARAEIRRLRKVIEDAAHLLTTQGPA